MAQREIFLEKPVTCPSCKTSVPTRYPNPRLYVAAKRESDMRVINYRWAEGAETSVLPHYYAVWQCSTCMFAGLADNILNPEGPRDIGDVLAAYSAIGMQEKLVLASMRKLVSNNGSLTFESALAIHLAALYIGLLPEKEVRNHNRLGRLALRIAWLYREQSGEITMDETEGSGPLESLKDRAASFENHLLTLSDIMNDMSELTRRRCAELGLNPDIGGDKGNPYSTVIASLHDKQKEMQTLLNMLQRTIISDSQGKITADSAGQDVQLGVLTDALMDMKSKWPMLPTDETQALRLAIQFFDYSYNHENFYQSIEQSMSVVSLIVDLFTRVGEAERALNYVAEIYKSGMRSKQELQSRIQQGRKNKTMTPHDERMLSRKIGNINVAIRQAGETRRKLIDLMIKQRKGTIDPIITRLAEASGEEQAAALQQAGIPDELIRELKSRGTIKEDKKKGFLSFGR